VFWDEFGFSFQKELATTWARRGKRPIFRRVTKERRAVSTAVALTLSGKIYKKHFEGSVNSKTLITALKHVQRQIPSKVILVWDRASIHTSKKQKHICKTSLKSLLKNYLRMLLNVTQKNIVMALSNNVSKMLVLKAKKKFVPCLIVALLVCVVNQIYLSVSFTLPVSLLGNFG
jgi:hypothetical protein